MEKKIEIKTERGSLSAAEKEEQPSPKKLKLKFILPLIAVVLLVLFVGLFIVVSNNNMSPNLAEETWCIFGRLRTNLF
jgi:hypothetical protein